MNPDHHRLLLVEDNPGDARLFREMLRDLGYARSAVVHVETARDAVRALADEEFHVLFLDLELPDTSGLETLDSVLDSGHDVPVIVLTGLSDETIGTTAVQRGAQDYLVKGEFHADVLARVIRYARGRHEAVMVATWESARAAAAEARLATLEESREVLEHEVTERRAAQAELERTLARLRAFRSIDRAIIANDTLAPMLDVVLHEGVTQLDAAAASVLLCEGDTLVPASQYRPSAECLPITPLSERDSAFRSAVRDGAVSLDAGGDGEEATFERAEGMRRWGIRGYHLLPLFSRDELIGALELFGHEPFDADPDWLAFADTLAGQAAVAVDRVRLQTSLIQANADLTAAYDDTIDGWSRALDLRDRETEGHSRRVTELSLHLAESLGFAGDDLGHLRRGALLHDIGKMGVPDAILQKPGPLDEQEWAIMMRHPTLAYELLAPIEYLRPALDVPYAHHERWDGSGYPRGLMGDQIPLAARIFAVADVYDALTSDRPYRRAWTGERAVSFTTGNAGVLFDPTVVEAFLRLRG